MKDKIGVNQIYSPSGLYSVLVHDDVLQYKKMYNLKEFFILNNESLDVQHYKLNNGESSVDNVFKTHSIVNIYWLSDTLLVCLQKPRNDMVQRVFSVDHENQTICHKKTRTFASNSDNFRFLLTQPCIVLDETSYIVYVVQGTKNEIGFFLQLITKNPFSTEKPRKYHVRIVNVPGYKEIYDIVTGIEGMSVYEPRFVNNNKLLCPLHISRSNRQICTIFGVFLEINLEKLEIIEENSVIEEEISDRPADDGISFVFLPKPINILSMDFYTTYKINEHPFDNIWITKKDDYMLRVVNFATMEHVRVVLPNKGPAVFTTHPSGLILQWYKTDEKIEFKKINISWKSDSLEKISRRNILYNKEIDYSHIRGFKQFLFPGAKFIEEEKTKKIDNQIIKEVKTLKVNSDAVKYETEQNELNF